MIARLKIKLITIIIIIIIIYYWMYLLCDGLTQPPASVKELSLPEPHVVSSYSLPPLVFSH